MGERVDIKDGTYPLDEINGVRADYDRCHLPTGEVALTTQVGKTAIILHATINEADCIGTDGHGTFEDNHNLRPIAVARELGPDGYGYENCTVTVGLQPE